MKPRRASIRNEYSNH